MLQIVIPLTQEGWDESKQMFVEPKTQVLQLEHSLISLSKWESKWHKPFLTKEEKTVEETIDYIKCMTLTKNVNPEVYEHMTQSNFIEINKYIENPMTATTITEEKTGKHNSEIVTSELIYYWMITLNIPVEFDKWHLNRLLTLIRVCNVKNTPQKNMSKRETAQYYAALNAARRKKYKSKG